MLESCIQETKYQWDTLSPIPDKTGFAGSFAGISNNALIVAGGSNFPDGGTPWNGGKKTWYDKIFVLEQPGGEWKEAGRLSRTLGYGVSITTANGLVCIGGSNAEGHYDDVLLLTYRQGAVAITQLPSLPIKLANSCGAMLDSCIYIAGGLTAPDAKNASDAFYMLDLKESSPAWRSLPSWPGPSRMLSVAGALDSVFYLFSGAGLENGQRAYLKDAYRYSPTTGWEKCADMPYPAVAAPTPAFRTDAHTLAVFGGDNGRDADSASVLRENHPGFSDDIIVYDSRDNNWELQGKILTRHAADAVAHPNNSIWAPVTTSSVSWHGKLVIPGGEVRPGTRTPNVLTATVTAGNP